MELRVKKSALMLTMGALVLALAGVGCGDDDAPAGGTGGTGGSGGSGGTGGGDPTVAECVDQAGDALEGVLPLTDTCLTCICTASVEDTVECNAAEDNDCWDLVKCSVVMCAGDMDCSILMCGDYIANGYGPATALRPAIEGCRSMCFPSDVDAGTEDGGDTDGGN